MRINYSDIALDSAGNIYIPEPDFHRVRRVDAATGIITTVAGNGFDGSSGDGGPATAAALRSPQHVAVDVRGNLFISGANRVRRVDATSGIITTVAGNGSYGFSGDGGLATAAMLKTPLGIAVSASGTLYIAEADNGRVRAVVQAPRRRAVSRR